MLLYLMSSRDRNLMFLRSFDRDVTDLDLNFTVVDDKFGETNVTELIPGGQNTSVTNENKLRFVVKQARLHEIYEFCAEKL